MSCCYFFIQIYYKPKLTNKENVRIFGENFVKNNKEVCKILYNDEEYELKEYFEEINKIYNHKTEFKIILKIPTQIRDISSMFSDCIYLYSFYSISKNLDHQELTSINSPPKNGSIESDSSDVNNDNTGTIYEGCKNTLSITKTNSSNENHFSKFFKYKNKILPLSDLSTLDTFFVSDMSNIFKDCKLLRLLPDISKWNTSNVNNMSGIFCGANSLKSLPDISIWETSNVINMSKIFCGCNSLKSLPDLSKWNTSNVINMNGLFYKCKSLIALPDISKWNTSNVTDISEIFHRCESLALLPNISKWKTNKIKDISGAFFFVNL